MKGSHESHGHGSEDSWGNLDTGVDNQENETGEEVKLSTATAKVKQELNPQITATLNKSNIKENAHK